MHHEFGQLMRLWGVVYYSLSPNELKPFAGMWNPGVMNTLRRFRENVFFVGVPFLTAFSIYSWATATHHKITRKNPDDYKDDE